MNIISWMRIVLFCLLVSVQFSVGQFAFAQGVGVTIRTSALETVNETVAVGQRVTRGGSSNLTYLVPHVGAETSVIIRDVLGNPVKTYRLREDSLTPLSMLVRGTASRSDRSAVNDIVGAWTVVDAVTGVSTLSAEAARVLGVSANVEARLDFPIIQVVTPAHSLGTATTNIYGDFKARAVTDVTPDVFFLDSSFHADVRAEVIMSRSVQVSFDHPESFSSREIMVDFTLDAIATRRYPGGVDLDAFCCFTGGFLGTATVNVTRGAQLRFSHFEDPGGVQNLDGSNSQTIDLRRDSPTRSSFTLLQRLRIRSQSYFGEADLAEGTFRLDSFYFEDGTSPEELGFDLVFDDGTISPNLRPDVLGDCDLNGVVNFLDISPFIAILSSGVGLAEADINEDGVVNFLDIAPFIVLLSS